ncbi:hypothetical protein CYQ27_14870 [Enterococcus faecalis]|uniref:DUF6275 family protein n=1 Tax=Enterococcus faecalis TaxID=1351 RepID=UPI00100EC944|nr:DUF6275 family protein [Enterococcus faecalis]RXV42115.1 hypothetical protein CYQ27_14870 [Enterococcus faecalis]
MNHEMFMEKCKELILEKENKGKNQDEYFMVKGTDIFVVWSCKTLQNSKAILSLKYTGAPLYEMTLNGDKKEIYMVAYLKESNTLIKV